MAAANHVGAAVLLMVKGQWRKKSSFVDAGFLQDFQKSISDDILKKVIAEWTRLKCLESYFLSRVNKEQKFKNVNQIIFET